MNENLKKEILFVDSNQVDLLYFSAFLKSVGLQNRLIHIANQEEALKFLMDDAGDIKIIMVGIEDDSEKPIRFIQSIKTRETIKYIPLVVLTNFWDAKETNSTQDFLINALYFRPLKLKTCRRIVELGGYETK